MEKTVLIVEDNPHNRKLFTLLVTALGHRVLAADNGRQGVETAILERPDVILMDIQMPEMDGIAALAKLRRHPATKAIPVVALTAYAMAKDRSRLLAAGFDAYLAKPISRQALNETLSTFLDPKTPKGE